MPESPTESKAPEVPASEAAASESTAPSEQQGSGVDGKAMLERLLGVGGGEPSEPVQEPQQQAVEPTVTEPVVSEPEQQTELQVEREARIRAERERTELLQVLNRGQQVAPQVDQGQSERDKMLWTDIVSQGPDALRGILSDPQRNPALAQTAANAERLANLEARTAFPDVSDEAFIAAKQRVAEEAHLLQSTPGATSDLIPARLRNVNGQVVSDMDFTGAIGEALRRQKISTSRQQQESTKHEAVRTVEAARHQRMAAATTTSQPQVETIAEQFGKLSKSEKADLFFKKMPFRRPKA